MSSEGAARAVSAFELSVPLHFATANAVTAAHADPQPNEGSDKSSSPASTSASMSADVPTPLYSPTTPWDDLEPTASVNKGRPPPVTRGYSFASGATLHLSDSPASLLERQRRVSTSVLSTATGTLIGSTPASSASIQSTSPRSAAQTPMTTVSEGSTDIWGTAASTAASSANSRTARAASDGLLVQTGFTPMSDASLRGREKSEGDAASLVASAQQEQQERAAMFREHERRSLESSAQSRFSTSTSAPGSRPSLFTRESATSPSSVMSASASPFFQPTQISSSVTPLLSPTSQEPASFPFRRGSTADQANSTGSASPGATSPTEATSSNGTRPLSASLHLGDLDAWMDEAYIRECCQWMGWDNVVNIKLIRGSSPSSGYCFLTFPSAEHAAQVLAKYNASPPTMMPRSNRTFKLNWGTGLPGLQPRWDGEYSVFVGDLGREVTEGDLVSLFTPIFASTKSAKVMCDPSTGLSRGYGFVRFSDESDMQRALALGQNTGSGLSLHGRTLRISEASGPNNNLGSSADRDRTKARMLDNLSMPSPFSSLPQDGSSPIGTPSGEYLTPTGFGSSSSQGALSPGFNSRSGPLGASSNAGSRSNHASDPNNTTVFVGGLPACISEETLRSFFHHFGDITYCKIPPGKGCGFVQFVRRSDAELAIAKMNDFPIHGKSRIRLSWGRSQGDKQVEHVRKLAAALGVPFESVWKMVQGQDNVTIKQIASAVGPNGQPSTSTRFDGRSGLGGVASAAGLSESDVKELVGGRSTSAINSPDLFAQPFSSANEIQGKNSANAGPYSRVSPSSFSSFAGSGSNGANGLPLSPPPSAGPNGFGHFASQQQSTMGMPPLGQRANPYSHIRPDSYTMQPPPSSVYGRVEFEDGGHSRGFGAAGSSRYGAAHDTMEESAYTDGPMLRGTGGQTTGLEDTFGELSFSSGVPPQTLPHHHMPSRGPPPPPLYRGPGHAPYLDHAPYPQMPIGRFSSPAPPDMYSNSMLPTPVGDDSSRVYFGSGAGSGGNGSDEPQWSAGWNNTNGVKA
ncbi:hypothetical protein ACM66B_006146 [Microbotryomycetes sp. NB124-2]